MASSVASPPEALLPLLTDRSDGPWYLKFWKVWPNWIPCPACVSCFSSCRRVVSRKKVRFQADGFDLDLVYLTPRVIVMGA